MSTVVVLVHTSHYTCVHRSKIIIDVLSFIEGKLEGKYYIIIKCHMLYNMCTYMHHTDEDAYIHVCMHHTDECICVYLHIVLYTHIFGMLDEVCIHDVHVPRVPSHTSSWQKK